jgi:restriction endonuclease S subunit
MTNKAEQIRLGDIAVVRSGLVLSRKLARGVSDNQYPLLNLRSINPDGYIDLKQMDVFYASEQLSAEYLSQNGDVIIRMSMPYTAVLIDEATTGIVISSNFVIIRCVRRMILPEYLFWLINRPSVKHAIYESTSSNMLAAVKAKTFSDFLIVLPAIAVQHRIAAMNALAIKETQLLRRLATEKERYYNRFIDNVYEEIMRGQ